MGTANPGGFRRFDKTRGQPAARPGEPARGKRSPEGIGELLASLLGGSEVGRSARRLALEEAWHRTVGAEIAAQTRVGGFRAGELEVLVRSSALLQELSTFYSASLLEALRADPGASARDLKSIRFRLGSC